MADTGQGAKPHGDLCFGCGVANVFGLHLDARAGPGADGRVVGRFFVKQDHQGPGGRAHAGVVAAALLEAMALAGGVRAPSGVALTFGRLPSVGTFVEIDADRDGATAREASTGEEVAQLRWRTT